VCCVYMCAGRVWVDLCVCVFCVYILYECVCRWFYVCVCVCGCGDCVCGEMFVGSCIGFLVCVCVDVYVHD